MHYSSLVGRISGESAEVWKIHYEARKRLERGEDIIILSVGEESGETTPDEIQEAAIASIRGGRHHYTPVLGEGRLREAIAQRHRERTGQRVGKANVAVFSGTQNALFAVCLCLLEHGDEVIVPELYYATYPATVTAGGAKLVPIPTRSGAIARCPLASSSGRPLRSQSASSPAADCSSSAVANCRGRGVSPSWHQLSHCDACQ